MIKGHKIAEKISVDTFLDIVKNYKEDQILKLFFDIVVMCKFITDNIKITAIVEP